MKAKPFLFAIVMAALLGVAFAGVSKSVEDTFTNFGYHTKQWNCLI